MITNTDLTGDSFLKQFSLHVPFTQNLVVEDFKLLKLTGKGIFGKVYTAKRISDRNLSIPDVTTMKIIPKSEIKSDEFSQKVYNEAKFLFCLSHVNIVKCYSSFENAAGLYLILEYLPTSLFTILKKQIYFGESTARYFSSQILMGIEYLHSFKIAHRDLKPENILISHNFYVKLTDMTFSKYIDGRSYSCQGTLEYMAPEILLNQGHGLPVDWWAFGVLVYEICSGYSPFTTRTHFNLIKKVTLARYQFPSHFSDELKDLIKKLLVPDATSRLGCTEGKENKVKDHPWYAEEIDWENINMAPRKLPKELNDLEIFDGTDSDINENDLCF